MGSMNRDSVSWSLRYLRFTNGLFKIQRKRICSLRDCDNATQTSALPLCILYGSRTVILLAE